MKKRHPRTPIALLALGALALAGCGSSSPSSTAPRRPNDADDRSEHVHWAAARGRRAAGSRAPDGRRISHRPAATRSSSSPQASASSAQLGSATGTFTPGTGRFAFALNASTGAFIYAPTALYIARSPKQQAQGPFLAPADPMTVAPQFRSKQNSGPGGIQAIYAAQLPLPHKGTYTILSLTRTQKGVIGAPGEVAVAPSSPIPAVGQRPPGDRHRHGRLRQRQHGAAHDPHARPRHARGVV